MSEAPKDGAQILVKWKQGSFSIGKMHRRMNAPFGEWTIKSSHGLIDLKLLAGWLPLPKVEDGEVKG